MICKENIMPAFFDNPAARKWVYGIALTIIPLLVAYGVLEEDAAPLWIALIGSVVAPTMALTHMPKAEEPEHGEE
jgi:hypothetical protein